ncbi:MAG: zinc dependent phospholipase C family protein [Planctomycetota bacterium]|jgi:hypothetical protein
MAGCITHIRIARTLLDDSSSPWVVARNQPECFLLGANAPDFGSFPGGHFILSDCAHLVRPADLVRNLFSLSNSDVERAFALGWLTHVIADVILHPVVNREVGRRLGMDREVSFVEDPAMHIRVEFGFDAFTVEPKILPYPRVSTAKLEPIAGLLSRAYQATYGVPFEQPLQIASCSALNRYAPWLISLARMHRRAERARYSPASWVLRALRQTLAIASADVRIQAHADPLRPGTLYTEEMESGIAQTVEECRRHAANQLVALENRNLDTGEPADASDTYPLTLKTKQLLDEWANLHPS